MYDVDVAILGAGTAGLGARRAAQREKASVLMLDPGPFGTTCARVGCMPSKLLIAAADAAHHARHADIFGVRAELTVDGPAVLRRVREERDRFVGFVERATDKAEAEGELLRERAYIVEPGVLRAGEHMVRYKRLVVATGTAPFVPPPFRALPLDVMITNEQVFELEDLPESLLVVGLGVIGLELGQAFARLGTRVTLVGTRGAIGPLTDPKVLASAHHHLSAELDMHPLYEFRQIDAVPGGVRFQFVDSDGKQRDEKFSRVLMAAGRRTTLDGIGLENLGLVRGDTGYPIDPGTLQLGNLPVFVAGDANGLHPLLHEAVDDGRIAGANAGRYPEVLAPKRRTPLGIVFSDPQIALVGVRFDDLAECSVAVGEIDWGDQGRSRVQNMNRGISRIYADEQTHRIIGAEMFGPRVEHMAHLIAWAVQSGLTVHQALDMPFYHPVVEEGLRTALRDLSANLRERRRVKCSVSELGVGS